MTQKLTILFDLDGTLVDTAPDLMGAHNHVMKKFGYPQKSLDDIKHIAGRGAWIMMQRKFRDEIKDEKLKKDDVVMFRIEQLYPFPAKPLVKEIKQYAENAKFYWCPEGPKNMGAWLLVRDYIQWRLNYIGAKNKEIMYIGRNPAASPATGYAKRHLKQQKEIIDKVFK